MGGTGALGMIKTLKENKRLLKATGYFKTMEDHNFKRTGLQLKFKKASPAEWAILKAKIEAEKMRSRRVNSIALISGFIILIGFLVYIN